MKPCLLIIAFLYPFLSNSQDQPFGNLTIFSDKGDKFFLYVNGEKKNELAQSKVRVEKLNQLSYSVKIVYDDASHFTVSKNNVFIADGDDNLMDAIYRVTRSGGNARLRFYAMNTVKENNAETLLPGIDYSNLKSYIPLTGALSVFSEQGDKFFLYLNGEKQNETAQSNIRIENLDQLYYTVKIIFQDTKLNIITKNNLFVSDGDDVMMDASYKLSRTSWYAKLKFYGMNPVKADYKAPAGLYVHRFGTSPVHGEIVAAEKIKNLSEQPVIMQKPAPDTLKENKQISSNLLDKQKIQPVEKASGNVSASTSASSPAVSIKDGNDPKKKRTPNTDLLIKEPAGWICQNEWPMWKADFVLAKKKITEEKNEAIKFEAAKSLANANCLSCDEVAEIAGLLVYEESKLEFVKYAFSHTIDYKNYFKVFKVLSSFKSKESLHAFISE